MDQRLQSKDIARCLVALFSVAWISNSGAASPLEKAHVTRAVNDVRLVSSDAVPRRASVNDNVDARTTLRTGRDSRAELTFADQTVARLAANTAFNFKDGTGNLNLSEGALLFQVPKGAKGVKVHAGEVAADITGSTVMFEHHPGMYKFLVLEGTGRLFRPDHVGDSVLVQAGQMVIGNPNSAVSDPVDVDIGRFLKTSRFIRDFPPLPSATLMVAESQKQQQQKAKKVLIDTNLVIFGGGTQVSLVEPTTPAASISSSSPTSDSVRRLRPTGAPVIDTAKTK